MNWIRLAWRNIIHQPLTLLLNVLLFALSIGLMYFLLMLNDQLKTKFDNNLADVDLVIGAKGSGLQMILCSMYHVDAPTGNIPMSDAKPFLNPQHPLIKSSLPLSLGDNYKGYRIVGTEHGIVDFYKASMAEGRLWNYSLEAVIGSSVADKLGLGIGDRFFSSHGLEEADDLAHDHAAIKVVGILKPSGSVLDQLIVTDTRTVWDVHDHSAEGHDHEGHDHDDHDHAHHDHEGHDHDDHDHAHDDHEGHDHGDHDHAHDDHEGHDHGDHDHAHHDHEGHDHGDHDHAHHDHDSHAAKALTRGELLAEEDKEITSMLIRYKNKTDFRTLSLARNINANTNLLAAAPPIVLNMLYDRMGLGTKALQLLALLIALVSAISIFISLFNSLRARKYELALLRVNGARPLGLFGLISFEGVLLAFIGFVAGIILAYVVFFFAAGSLSERYHYNFDPFQWHPSILWIGLGALAIGFIAALLPAIKAYRMDIHHTLSK